MAHPGEELRDSVTGRQPHRRSRRPHWISALALVAVLAGCASSGGPGPAATSASEAPRLQPLSSRERAFFLNPVDSFELRLDSAREAEIRNGWTALVERRDVAAAFAVVDRLLEVDPGLPPALLLAAQARLVDGQAAAAHELLVPLVERYPGYEAARLALGRAAEEIGDIVGAFAAYRVSESGPAAERAERLAERSREIVRNRFDEQLARGRFAAAADELSRLEAWAPDDVRTLEAARRLAFETGDAAAELTALRRLAPREEATGGLVERRADLELEIGDAAAGLRIFQDLARSAPNDPRLAARLEAAEFRWRLTLLPTEVQETARRAELTRADFAILLFWLVPDLRYEQPTQVRIANDILDHERRDEIARIANLELMAVESSRHRFFPEEPVERAQALAALLRLLDLGGAESASCSGEIALTSPVATVCEAAVRCRLIDRESDCLPRASLSGSVAVELIRRALELR